MLETTKHASEERERLLKKYAAKLEDTQEFSRKTVSFQASKDEPVYRWFKYKEGFASILVKKILTDASAKPGNVLDPFAGAGTTLFAGSELGWTTTGIELLPVGIFVMEVRQAIRHINLAELNRRIETFWDDVLQIKENKTYIHHIPITQGAFPRNTEKLLNKYISYCHSIEDKHLRNLFLFGAFAILEEISYTRKDGQYLRWDSRSPRSLRGSFNKGQIYSFEEAIKGKMNQIVADLGKDTSNLSSAFSKEVTDQYPAISVSQGSCLDMLPALPENKFDFVVTSPPYCNRYDYTRTYALELVFLGYNNDQVRDLRQTMLSCTVENKEKVDYLRKLYESNNRPAVFENVMNVYYSTGAMVEVNNVLDELNVLGKLNNTNVSRMVKNYFLEMCFVIFELSRVLKPGGRIAMVNDNVRYGGEEIPVDLILSEFAARFDMEVEKIFVLPQKKGNSSQQMGVHGRTEIRKCIYLWQKKLYPKKSGS